MFLVNSSDVSVDDALVSFDRGEDRTTASIVAELDSLTAAGNRIQRELFRALIRCELRRVWLDDDCRDIAHWVALRLGITTYKARRWVACAWALERYPLFERAFEDGRLSLDKLVELTRLADAEDEPEEKLLSWALRVSIASIRDRADWARKSAEEDVRDAHRKRSVKWWWDEDNTFVNLHAELPADMGIRITSALDRIARKLPASPEDYTHDDHDEPESLDARRADALYFLAGQSIAHDNDPDRATVVVHAPLSALVSGDANGCDTEGHAVHPEVISRLACDGRLQMVLHGEERGVIGIGETARAIPRWLRRAVERRDGFRCTFPNCGSRLGLDCHHVVPWPQGPTDVDNLTLICRVHHRLVHDYGWHVMLAADQSARWFRPDWTPYVPRPVTARVAASTERGSEAWKHPARAPKHPAGAPKPTSGQPERGPTDVDVDRSERSYEVNGFRVTPWWERLGGAAVF